MENNSRYKMKHLIFIFFALLLSSCYWDEDLNNYNTYNSKQSRNVVNFWYYNDTLFKNHEYCQLIGTFENDTINEYHYVNRRCMIYNDTIYPKPRYVGPNNTIFNGIIIIDSIEHFVNIKLN